MTGSLRLQDKNRKKADAITNAQGVDILRVPSAPLKRSSVVKTFSDIVAAQTISSRKSTGGAAVGGASKGRSARGRSLASHADASSELAQIELACDRTSSAERPGSSACFSRETWAEVKVFPIPLRCGATWEVHLSNDSVSIARCSPRGSRLVILCE